MERIIRWVDETIGHKHTQLDGMFDNPAAEHHVICVKNRGLARSDRHLRFIKY